MGAFTGVASQIGQQFAIASALDANFQPDPSKTTTAVTLLIVAKGIPQGLIRSMRIDEQFNTQRVRAIGKAINVAFPTGVYEASATLSKSFIYGQTLEQAFGGGLRPVVGQQQVSPDFTKFYFNIVEVDSRGNAMATRHDCVITSLSRAYEIDQVIIMEDCQILIRWSD